MTKGRTLRRIRKPSKKTYLSKGGQQALEYRDIQDAYVAQITAKKELYNTIQLEATSAYNYETTKKNNSSLTEVQNIISFINSFYDMKNSEYNEVVDSVKSMIDKYGLEYKSYFIPSLKLLKESLNDINNLISYVTRIQTDFTAGLVHLHLINQRFGLLNSAKDYTNVINKQFVKVTDSIKKIEAILIKEESQKKAEREGVVLRTEVKKTELTPSIGLVKRDYPVNFIPNSNPFIQGCPLGTVLGENDQCNYYNDTTLLESVPIQKNLLNTETSEWVVWFNSITPSSVNDPIIFQRKPMQYLMPLRAEDIKYFTEKDDPYFNVKYVVTEQNGAPYKDPNGYYIFINDVFEQPLNIPGFSKYYVDSTSLPQAVQIVDIPEQQKPIFRNSLEEDKYFKSLHDIDQILYGIKFVETDKDGNLPNGTIIPFYPNYNDYAQNILDYVKLTSNEIDSITYRYKGEFEKRLENFNTLPLEIQQTNLGFTPSPSPTATVSLEFTPSPSPSLFGGQLSDTIVPAPALVPAPAATEVTYASSPQPTYAPSPQPTQTPVFDTLALDPHACNIITNIYANKYLQMSIDKYYNPFVFPQFFLNEGDYFVIHNIGKEPIVFNISANSEQKRVVVYPNQLSCFVFTNYSTTIRYGCLFLDRYIATQTKSSKAAKYNDTYIFVENNQPLFDTEHNLIPVPNFNEITKTYYEYDDIFETTPKQISEIVNVPVLDFDISKKFSNYSSPYVTLTTIGVTYVFCDASGNPLLDILGYFIPVPSPLHYNNSKYLWYALEKVKEVTLLNNYEGVVGIDEDYTNKQFNSSYSTTINNFSIYINSQGFPLLANRESYLGVPPDSPVKTEVKQVQVFLPQNFKISLIDEKVSTLQIKTQMLVGLLKVYAQNTQVLENYYTDISGNMNNLSSLRDQLNNAVNEIQISVDLETLNTKEAEAKELYEEVLKTKKNLEKYSSDRIQLNVYNQEVNKIRETRNNDMTNISIKIQNIKDNSKNLKQLAITLIDKVNTNNNLVANSKAPLISKLNKSSLDISTVEQSEKTLEQTFEFVKNSINTSDTIEKINKQAPNINILLKSSETLEKNVTSVAETLNNVSIEISSTEINVKKEKLVELVNTIATNKTTVNQNTAYLESLPTDNVKINEQKQIIQNSMKVVNDIATTVENDQKVVATFTPEIVDEQLIRYNNYVDTSIKNEMKNIEAAVTTIQGLQATASTTQLVELKTRLLQKINDFKEKHTSIETLLNNISSRITDEQKQSFEVELLNNYNTVIDIENSIDTLTTDVNVNAAISNVADIDALNDTIQYNIQTLELNTLAAPAPAGVGETGVGETGVEETVIENEASPNTEEAATTPLEPPVTTPLEPPATTPTLQGGKKKRWPTRKNKRKVTKSVVGK